MGRLVAHCLVVLLLISAALPVWAQPDSLLTTRLYRSVEEGVVDFTTDNLGNIFLVFSTGQIKKLDENGDSIAIFNDVRRHGKIYSVDATNPLKILVYYKDFATIVVLDRLMNVRNTIDLRKQNIFQVRAITSSYDNNTWLFDELESKIKKVDDNGNVLMQSTDFRQLFDTVPAPHSLVDRDGELYLYDPAYGLLIFDYYGARKNNIPLKGITDFQVVNKNLITGKREGKIFVYKPASLEFFYYHLTNSLTDYRKVRFHSGRLLALTGSGSLQIFQTN